MCGRFAQVIDISTLIKKLLIEKINDSITQRFNLAPSQNAAVVFNENGIRTLSSFKWGVEMFKSPLINIRSEKLYSSWSSISENRCIVPVSGFYEWRGKKPYYFHTETPFYLGGLFESNSFGVLTKESSGIMSKFHHRMPLLIDNESVNAWLNRNSPRADINRIIENSICDSLGFHEVSSLVNSVANSSPECIKPFYNNNLTLF